MKVKVKVKSPSHVQLLVTPMDCSLPGSSVHGIFRARVLEWGAIAFSHIYVLVVSNNKNFLHDIYKVYFDKFENTD